MRNRLAWRFLAWGLIGLSLLGISPGTSTSAADPPAKSKATAPAVKGPESSPLDDALLKDLDNELLEGAGDLKESSGNKRSPLDPSGVDGEDLGMGSEDDDPLSAIGQEMRSVESLIPTPAKRPHAEQLQERIVAD